MHRHQEGQHGLGERGKKLRLGVIAAYSLPKRNCYGCEKQEEWGCDAERTVKKWNKHGKPEQIEWKGGAAVPLFIDGEEWYRCPRRPIKDNPLWWNYLLSQYAYYKAGHLLEGASIQDQPSKLMVLFRQITSVISEIEENNRNKPAPRGKGNVVGR